jgi:glycosyltransferase involved in cell wall biosynthesis
MLNNRKIVVVLPAYNASRTLEMTVREIPAEIVDAILLVDDGSKDDTVSQAVRMGIPTFVHDANYGYGRNQKTCYNEALKLGADVVVMLHPDYQYTPRLITAMASMIAFDVFDAVLGSRVLGGSAVAGGMPRYKYVANRFLTLIQNILQRQKLSEFHTGYRAFSSQLLIKLPLMENSDDFVFDNEMLAQMAFNGFRIGEVSCPAHYFDEASSINFGRSVKYGLGVLWTALRFRLQRWGLTRFRIFEPRGRRLPCIEEREGYYVAAGPLMKDTAAHSDGQSLQVARWSAPER